MSRPVPLDLADLRQGYDYLGSLADLDQWDALLAEIEAAKGLLSAAPPAETNLS